MWCNFVKVNITTKLILRISMDSYINDYCAFLHIGLIHELWFANCNHQNICLSGNFLHILCFGVAYGYCTVFSKQKHCHRFTYNIASSHNYAALTGNLNSRAF